MSNLIVRSDWAGDEIRLAVDGNVPFRLEFEISIESAERLIENLQHSITGARKFQQNEDWK